MIKFTLRCSEGHEFEEWFSNNADYDAKAADGAIACPECGNTKVAKAIMAPNIGAKSSAAPEPPRCGAPACQSGACAFAGR